MLACYGTAAISGKGAAQVVLPFTVSRSAQIDRPSQRQRQRTQQRLNAADFSLSLTACCSSFASIALNSSSLRRAPLSSGDLSGPSEAS